MKILQWGFIGCGEVTEKKSGPAFSEVEGSSVVAVMSRDERKARSYAERHGIPRWYTDAQELIDDPDVNAVYIATPPSSHATYAIMAMKAGKPVYVEKPLAASYAVVPLPPLEKFMCEETPASNINWLMASFSSSERNQALA